MKKNKNIILCLDIDDAILPNPNTYFGRIEDAHEVLKLNMKRIKLILDSQKDMKVFITSSWFCVLYLNDDNTLGYKRENDIENGNLFLIDEYNAFKIIQEGLGNRVIGLSCGDRVDDILDLINDDNLVIALDDMDLSKNNIWFHSENVDKPKVDKNYMFLDVNGFITNRMMFKIYKFLESHNVFVKPME